MTDLEKLLEDVAREISGACQDARGLGYDCDEAHERVIRKRLLPLLEAGQAMREEKATYLQHMAACWAWDAALEKAKVK